MSFRLHNSLGREFLRDCLSCRFRIGSFAPAVVLVDKKCSTDSTDVIGRVAHRVDAQHCLELLQGVPKIRIAIPECYKLS